MYIHYIEDKCNAQELKLFDCMTVEFLNTVYKSCVTAACGGISHIVWQCSCWQSGGSRGHNPASVSGEFTFYNVAILQLWSNTFYSIMCMSRQLVSHLGIVLFKMFQYSISWAFVKQCVVMSVVVFQDSLLAKLFNVGIYLVVYSKDFNLCSNLVNMLSCSFIFKSMSISLNGDVLNNSVDFVAAFTALQCEVFAHWNIDHLDVSHINVHVLPCIDVEHVTNIATVSALLFYHKQVN